MPQSTLGGKLGNMTSWSLPLISIITPICTHGALVCRKSIHSKTQDVKEAKKKKRKCSKPNAHIPQHQSWHQSSCERDLALVEPPPPQAGKSLVKHNTHLDVQTQTQIQIQTQMLILQRTQMQSTHCSCVAEPVAATWLWRQLSLRLSRVIRFKI